MLILLKFYKKFISPILEMTFGHACRFTPTCSDYTISAIEDYGTLKGSWMGFKRLLKCNPWYNPQVSD